MKEITRNRNRICNASYLIKKAMENAKIETYAELERKAKMDNKISIFLNGGRLSLSDLNKMCMALGVQPEYFKECVTENTYYTVNDYGNSTGIWNRKVKDNIEETKEPETFEEGKIIKKCEFCGKEMQVKENSLKRFCDRKECQHQRHEIAWKKYEAKKKQARADEIKKQEVRKEKESQRKKTYYERNKEKILQKNKERYQAKKKAMQLEKEKATQKENIIKQGEFEGKKVLSVTDNIIAVQEPKKKGFFAKLFGKK